MIYMVAGAVIAAIAFALGLLAGYRIPRQPCSEREELLHQWGRYQQQYRQMVSAGQPSLAGSLLDPMKAIERRLVALDQAPEGGATGLWP